MSRPGPARATTNVTALFSDPSKTAEKAKLPIPGARTGSLNPPDWLSPFAKKTWREVVATIQEAAPDWLTTVDPMALALMFEHYAMAKAASEAMRKGGGHLKVIDTDEAHGNRRRKHPAHQVFRESSAAFLSLAKEFGLTPLAREGLGLSLFGGSSGDDEDEDLFDS